MPAEAMFIVAIAVLGLAFELLAQQTSHSSKRRSENSAELEEDPLMPGSSNSPSYR